MAWLKIDKDLVDRWLRTDGEKLLWWIDMLQMAAWRDADGLLRGQLRASLSGLLQRWDTTKKKVRNFLEFLEQTGRIERSQGHDSSIITIVEFSEAGAQQGHTKGTARAQKGMCVSASYTDEGHSKGTPRAQQGHTTLVKNIINNNNISSLRDDATAPACAREWDSDSGRKSWDGLRDFFNRTMDERGARIPKIKAVTDRRLTAVMARAREYGGDAVYEVITKAASSPFLNGGGNHVFVADFDWLFRPNNFPKVLEGNYDERFTNNKNATRYDADNWTSGEAGGQGSDSGYEQRRNEAGALVARLLGEG